MAKFKLHSQGRGEHSGQGFYFTSMRFDLPLAQKIEKTALAYEKKHDKKISFSAIVTQAVEHAIDNLLPELPKGLKLEKTKEPSKGAPAPGGKKAKKGKKEKPEKSEKKGKKGEKEKDSKKSKKKADKKKVKGSKKKSKKTEEEDEEEDDEEEEIEDDLDEDEEEEEDEDE